MTIGAIYLLIIIALFEVLKHFMRDQKKSAIRVNIDSCHDHSEEQSGESLMNDIKKSSLNCIPGEMSPGQQPGIWSCALHRVPMYTVIVPAFAIVMSLLVVFTYFDHTLQGRKTEESVNAFIYYCYFGNIRDGLVPYRDVPLEYPPLFIPLIVVPGLFAQSFRLFEVSFALEMLFFNALLLAIVTHELQHRVGEDRVPARLAYYGLCFLFLSRLIVTGFDIVPTMLAFLSACYWFSGRARLGGMMAGLGALTKVFPIVVVLPGLVADFWQRSRKRFEGSVSFAATLFVGLTLWFSIGGRGALESLLFHSQRGIVASSLYGAIMLFLGKLLRMNVRIVHDHNSCNVISSMSPIMLSLSSILPVLAMVVILWMFSRRGCRDGLRYAGACILGLSALSKLGLYPIWVLPFIVVLDGVMGRRVRWLFAVTCCISGFLTREYRYLAQMNTWIIVLVNARNLMSLYILWLMVFYEDGDVKTEGE